MKKPVSPHFSRESLEFIRRASRQKRADWLDRNTEDFQSLVRQPLQALAGTLAQRLKPSAPGYHFPLKGIGRLKRSTIRAQEYGSCFKSYVSFTITRPAQSRFDHNPSLFFMMNSEDREGDEVLLAGGLYLPSSRQLKTIREKISENPEPFVKLFRSKPFVDRFPGGFSDERIATRPPRGFDPQHSHAHWLKLQGFFVWRSYSVKEYTSPEFADQVAKDGAQILRLNELLDQALQSRWPEKIAAVPTGLKRSSTLLDRMGEDKLRLNTPDF